MGLFLYKIMSLKEEVPRELQQFAELIDKASGRYGYNEIFEDWVDYMIACFSFEGDPKLVEHLKKKYGDVYAVFDNLLREYINVCNRELGRKEWYDGLGIIYETISSRWKSSRMGQFFTPPSLVDVMVGISEIDENVSGKTVCDPACGSGRFLIAHHAHNPKNYQYGQDLDRICAKMTAVNMMIHGCRGEVACMNTITMEWYFGFYINPYIKMFGKPQIVPVKKYEDSIFYAGGSIFEQNKKKESKQLTVVDVGELKKEPVKKEVIKQVIVKVEPAQIAQLSLF